MTWVFGLMQRMVLLSLVGLMAACGTLPSSDKPAPETSSSLAWPIHSTGAGEAGATALWRHHTFPTKRATRYQLQQIDGRLTLHSQAQGAASMLRRSLRVEAPALGRLKFSWKVPALIPQANLAERSGDDSPVRVILIFEGDRSNFSPKNAMLSELAQTLTGEALPYATLMYVWGKHSLPGSVMVNHRTDRVRALVLESGAASLGQWLEYERDIAADFKKVFGEAPGALVAIAIMTDTDNTQQHASAWYGPLTLLSHPVSD